MIFLKSKQEVEEMSKSAAILSKLHGIISREIKDGVTTKFLNKLAEEFINDNGAKSSFKGYKKFPAAICTSVNDCIVHGIPNDIPLKNGDIVSIDCGVYYNGFHSDSAYTHPIGEVDLKVLELLKATKEALNRGIEKFKIGNRLGDIGHAIGCYIKKCGYSIAENLVGHGIGRSLHESPEVPNFGKMGNGIKLKDGLVLAIEPMVNLGSSRIYTEKNGDIKTFDGKFSAHFEHTVALIDGETKKLTSFDYITGSI
jgi:methionyl aminopeptidase